MFSMTDMLKVPVRQGWLNRISYDGCFLWPGPQCILSCAKEHRVLPKQGFTCCLALDGVKVLPSGFDMEEKVLCLYYINVSYFSAILCTQMNLG